MVVSTVVIGDVGGGTVGGGDVSPPQPKHYSPLFHKSSYIGAVSGGGVASRSAGGKDMVGAGMI